MYSLTVGGLAPGIQASTPIQASAAAQQSKSRQPRRARATSPSPSPSNRAAAGRSTIQSTAPCTLYWTQQTRASSVASRIRGDVGTGSPEREQRWSCTREPSGRGWKVWRWPAERNQKIPRWSGAGTWSRSGWRSCGVGPGETRGVGTPRIETRCRTGGRTRMWPLRGTRSLRLRSTHNEAATTAACVPTSRVY